MPDLITFEKPALKDPILVVGFSGTFDMAEVSTATVGQLDKRVLAKDVAMVDPERLYNFSHTRPVSRVDKTGSRIIDWPGIQIKVGTYADRDLILLSGDEPSYRWRSCSSEIAELMSELGCKLAISLGAVNGLIPHTRDLPVYGYTTNADLADRHRLDKPEYSGPTGYMASLNYELEKRGIPSISIRVEIPHYLPAPPCPKGVQSLLDYIEELTGVNTYADELDQDVDHWEDLVTEAVGMDEENVAYVSQLEQQYDNEEEMLEAGYDLVIELEQMLQDPADAEPEDEADEPQS